MDESFQEATTTNTTTAAATSTTTTFSFGGRNFTNIQKNLTDGMSIY